MTAGRLAKELLLTLAFFITLAAAHSTAAPVNAAGIQTFEIQADGLRRTYTVYEPAGHNSKKPAAVVIMLHGAGGTGEGVIRETAWDKKAEQEGFLVVFPDALRVNQDAEPSFLTNPQMWNDGSKRGSGLLHNADDVKFLSLVLDDLAKKYVIDHKAIFITGFSSGASMLFKAANELPGKFAAIAPVSGHYWPPSVPPIGKPTPTIMIIGTADPLNPFEGGPISLPWGIFEQPPFMKSIHLWSKQNKFPADLKEAPGKPGVKILRITDKGYDWCRVYIVEGLGHMWPGGEAIFPESFIGKDPGSLDATKIIWDYFAEIRAKNL